MYQQSLRKLSKNVHEEHSLYSAVTDIFIFPSIHSCFLLPLPAMWMWWRKLWLPSCTTSSTNELMSWKHSVSINCIAQTVSLHSFAYKRRNIFLFCLIHKKRSPDLPLEIWALDVGCRFFCFFFSNFFKFFAAAITMLILPLEILQGETKTINHIQLISKYSVLLSDRLVCLSSSFSSKKMGVIDGVRNSGIWLWLCQ